MSVPTFKIKYSEGPEYFEEGERKEVTTCSVTEGAGTLKKLNNIIQGFLDNDEDVEVSIKHKPGKE